MGIVTEVGADWATVRAVCDDYSNVSAMISTTSDVCVISGNLTLLDEGKLELSRLMDQEDKVSVGASVVTSHISDKISSRNFNRLYQRPGAGQQSADKIRLYHTGRRL